MAEALGRFGEQGITSAFYWTYPPADSPARSGRFAPYRNFDGKGAHFLDRSLSSSAPEGCLSSFRAPRTRRQMVAVLLNLDPHRPANAALALHQCGGMKVQRVLTYDGDPVGFMERIKPTTGMRVENIPPYSMNVIELREP